MLLSCWPPLCPVTHYWKCCNDMCSTVVFYMAIPSPHRPFLHYVQCLVLNVRAVRLLSSITQSSWCVLICFEYVCLSGICLSVLWTILDKSYVSALPWGWMSLYISPNKASLCPCWSGQCNGFHIFPRFRLSHLSCPLHLLLSGKPMVCGFCLGSVCYIQTS